MSIDVAFFSAPDDASAARAEQRPGGPIGWPVETATRRTGWFQKRRAVQRAEPSYDGFTARNYDGIVSMGTLEELLTGRPYDSLEDDPRWGAGVSGKHSSPVRVFTLTQTLRDALANADDATLKAVARPWADTEELAPPDGSSLSPEEIDGHVAFLTQLRDLAVRARGQEHQLYWYFVA